MPKIGVFWFHKGDVMGREVDLADGEEGVPGLKDSPDNHTDLWDGSILRKHPELRGREYYEVPRGRVLWDSNQDRAIVYLDASLFKDDIKAKITQFFNLKNEEVVWRTDPHYITDDNNLERLFND